MFIYCFRVFCYFRARMNKRFRQTVVFNLTVLCEFFFSSLISSPHRKRGLFKFVFATRCRSRGSYDLNALYTAETIILRDNVINIR